MSSYRSTKKSDAKLADLAPEFALEDVKTHYVPILALADALEGSQKANIEAILKAAEKIKAAGTADSKHFTLRTSNTATTYHTEQHLGSLNSQIAKTHVSYDLVQSLVDEGVLTPSKKWMEVQAPMEAQEGTSFINNEKKRRGLAQDLGLDSPNSKFQKLKNGLQGFASRIEDESKVEKVTTR